MDKNILQFLKSPLAIGKKSIESRLILSPMAGLGHVAFRELLAGFGGYGLLFTEMCSSKALLHENRYVSPVFRWRDEELETLVCQIFGSDPQTMADAAMRIENEGFFGVDINLGCSVSAICKQNAGAALLKDPSLAEKIVASVRKSITIPLFVKFRTGWKDDPDAAVDFAKSFEQAGADALTFHPRVAPDRRSRPPKWDYIRKVKQSVSIPVFGNGNVFDAHDCKNMLETSNCDGIVLGRIAVARPWIFSSWMNGYEPTEDIYLKTALDAAVLLEKHYDRNRALKLFKKFAIYFTANFRFGHSIYSKLCKAEDMEEIKNNIEEIFSPPHDILSVPNMNKFVE